MKDCIFCEIVSGKRESARIWEDKKFLAILDGNPNVKGMTLVLTKDHYDSYVFDIEGRLYREYMAAAKEVRKDTREGIEGKTG
jgi:Diadenosine tetraphosphate (Ap4A) hydrolase and other HIT family hydrolases